MKLAEMDFDEKQQDRKKANMHNKKVLLPYVTYIYNEYI